MGEELVQVLPFSAFETGDLRPLRDTAALLHGLVRDGAQIVRGNRAQPIASFAEAQAWLLEEAKRGRQKIGRAHVELQSLMRISYAVFCLKKKKQIQK